MVKQPNTPTSPHKVQKYAFASYDAPRQTSIPPELEEHFEAEGYDHKWVRIINPKTGGVDVANLAKRARQGFTPVTHAEIRSLNLTGVSEMFERGADAKTKDYIVVNDVALFKREKEITRQHKAHYEGEAWQQMKDVQRKFSQNGVKVDTMSSTFKNQKAINFAQDQQVDLESED